MHHACESAVTTAADGHTVLPWHGPGGTQKAAGAPRSGVPIEARQLQALCTSQACPGQQIRLPTSPPAAWLPPPLQHPPPFGAASRKAGGRRPAACARPGPASAGRDRRQTTPRRRRPPWQGLLVLLTPPALRRCRPELHAGAGTRPRGVRPGLSWLHALQELRAARRTAPVRVTCLARAGAAAARRRRSSPAAQQLPERPEIGLRSAAAGETGARAAEPASRASSGL